MRRLFVLSLVLALALLVVGCGGSLASTTTSAPATAVTTAPTTTTTAAPTTTTAAPTTTTAAPTTTTLSETAVALKYAAAIMVWFEAFGKAVDSAAETPDDVTKITDAQIQADRAFLAQLHSLSDQWHAMQPPASMAAAHQKVADAFDALVTLSDKGVAAEASRDQAAYDAANAELDKLGTAFLAALEELQKAAQGGVPTT
jgi:uncharacterized protein YcfL